MFNFQSCEGNFDRSSSLHSAAQSVLASSKTQPYVSIHHLSCSFQGKNLKVLQITDLKNTFFQSSNIMLQVIKLASRRGGWLLLEVLKLFSLAYMNRRPILILFSIWGRVESWILASKSWHGRLLWPLTQTKLMFVESNSPLPFASCWMLALYVQTSMRLQKKLNRFLSVYACHILLQCCKNNAVNTLKVNNDIFLHSIT